MDEHLAQLLKDEPNPVEKLAADQTQCLSAWVTNTEVLSAHFLTTGQRIVALECGHFALSRALHRAACPRCGEMIRSGYDHDGFRRLGMPDEFSWPADPLIALNEAGRRDGSDTITRASSTG